MACHLTRKTGIPDKINKGKHWSNPAPGLRSRSRRELEVFGWSRRNF